MEIDAKCLAVKSMFSMEISRKETHSNPYFEVLRSPHPKLVGCSNLRVNIGFYKIKAFDLSMKIARFLDDFTDHSNHPNRIARLCDIENYDFCNKTFFLIQENWVN